MRAPGLIACVLVLGVASGARAQPRALPERAQLLVPTCRALPWATLARALEVELRTMGSGLAGAEPPDLRVALDLPCEGDPTEARVTLVHVASGRTHTDLLPLGDRRGLDRVRTIAVGISEIVRARYPQLATAPPPPEPPPPPPPVVDVGRFRTEIEAAARAAVALAVPRPEPEPPPPPRPSGLVDLTFGVNGYPAASNASAELRVGYSLQAPAVRLAIDGIVTGGWGSDAVGEVALGGLGLGLALRFSHDEPGWAIAAGLRVDGGWARASGLPTAPGARSTTLDGAHIAAVIDARVRFRLDERVWFVLQPEAGAALVGLDVGAGGRRVTAQIGPRLGLSVGASIAP